MKILVAGASGTIGRAVAAELAPRHDIIAVGRASGDVTMDITDEASSARLSRPSGRWTRWCRPPVM